MKKSKLFDKNSFQKQRKQDWSASINHRDISFNYKNKSFDPIYFKDEINDTTTFNKNGEWLIASEAARAILGFDLPTISANSSPVIPQIASFHLISNEGDRFDKPQGFIISVSIPPIDFILLEIISRRDNQTCHSA